MAAARRRADCAAVLLRAGDPIGKSVVGSDVINLRRRLVVPGTPGHGGVDADDRTLIAAEHHAPGIVRIDPKLMEIVAGWIAFDGGPGLAGIGRAIDRSVHYINEVGILRVGRDLFEIPTTAPKPLVDREFGPGGAGIIRAKHAAIILGLGGVFGMILIVNKRVNNGVDAIVICRRD